MIPEKIHFSELPFYEQALAKDKQNKVKDWAFDLGALPTEQMKKEFREYICSNYKKKAYATVCHDRTYYQQVSKFLGVCKLRGSESLLDKEPDKWIHMLKGWMLANGIALTQERKSLYGTVSVSDGRLIQYFKRVLEFLQPEDMREETEKDVWRLEKLNIILKANPIYNVKTLDFRKIWQPDIKEEAKKAVYMNLKYESLGTVQGEMGALRKFSRFLKESYPSAESCADIDRETLEAYLISRMTEETSHHGNSTSVLALRRILETVAKIYQYENLEKLFLNTDIPPEIQPEFKVYSDAEMKRLNEHITRLDEQIARCMVLHQLLGTRISDTLTLEQDCISEENGQFVIEIHQVKTNIYRKPVNEDVAELIERSVEYTNNRYGDCRYVFVDDKNPERPLQYTTVKNKVLRMIANENLLDDRGQRFKFNSHCFRRYYGVKLTEMHLDDWTIARLLGHKRLGNVQHYRKMSNQRMADETREIRKMMSDIIYSSLGGWGGEYEQIRQDD